MEKKMIKGVNMITSFSGGTEVKEVITLILSEEWVKKFGKTIHPLNITWKELFQVKDVLSSMKEDEDLILIVEDEIFLEHDRSKKKLFLGIRRNKEDAASVLRFELTEDVLKQFNAVLDKVEKEEIEEEVKIMSTNAEGKSFIQTMFESVDKAVEKVMAEEAERITKKKAEEGKGESSKEEKPAESATVTLPKDKSEWRKAVIERETFKESVARKQAEDKAKEAETKPTTEGKDKEATSSPTK